MAQMVRNLSAMQEFNPWVRKIPWRREWLPNPVFLPGESHARLPGIEPTSLLSLALAGRFFTTSITWEVPLTLRWLSLPWRRAWPPTSVFLPGESHGHRSLVGYSPWGHKESNMTEQLTLCFSHSEYVHGSVFHSP